MTTTLQDPAQWAQMEFGMTDLGDVRRTRRLVQVAAKIGHCPKGVLPESFEQWSELKAAYRLFSNPEVKYESIALPHWQRTAQACCQPGEYLLIEDGSELDFSWHRQTQGLGRIGNDGGYGMMLHSTLALRVESWRLDQSPEVQVVGLLGQQNWVRQGPSRRQQKERWRQRMKRERESQYWASRLSILPPKPAAVEWIYLADREADIYEVFERCDKAQVDHIIRAQHSRALVGEDQKLFAAIAQQPVLGEYELELRARPGMAARIAKIQVRVMEVTLRGVERPEGRQAPRCLRVVEAREIEAPEGVEAVHWVLLTSLPVSTFTEARRIITRYAQRWFIEEYHKALKTGAGMEKSQLEAASRLQALLGVLAVMAVRLLNTKQLAHTQPHRTVDPKTLGPEGFAILNAKFGKPQEGWTYQTLLIAIARLGGFVGRRSDGLPGWLSLWRGMQKLMLMIEGAQLLAEAPTYFEGRRCG